ncbi:MAG: T9SS type A sorting domain-containing protein [Bacteroidota bacterium]|nr:T9SS type A sorting domain-containing protein [Bacteroidota bacterium]
MLLIIWTNKSTAQYGQLPPFTFEIQAIPGTNLAGLHSFAFAQSGDKWLFIGGRTNGLHGLNSSGGFPPEYKNENVIVIDTSTWTSYSADLNQLSYAIADPMRSTNMQYIQDGNFLYMLGGYGYDSVASMFVTFPKLTAIHVDNIISAVINAQPIAPHIRQVADTNLQVCGGEMGKIGSDFYLLFGHNFGGRYTDPPSPLWTQTYSDRIKKFNINDDGTTITLSNYSYFLDTTNYHRRDLSSGPVVRPDGSFGLGAYGGVFRREENIPFLEPITVEASGTTVSPYEQTMSHYSCALIPVYDSVTQKMYSTFLGGISLNDYNPSTGLIVYDSLVPFISDITTLTVNSDATAEECVLPLQMPGLLGTNAKFILNNNLSIYSNEVIRFRDLPASYNVLAGYMFGGIRAQQGNFGLSAANDTIYRVYIKRVSSMISVEESDQSVRNISIFPNPTAGNSTLQFRLTATEKIRISVQDLTGKEMLLVADEEMQKGLNIKQINTSGLPNGVYICRISSAKGESILKLVTGK